MLMFLLDGTSRMTGDCHVRFCERLRGETPLCLLGGKKKFNHKGTQRITQRIHKVNE